MPRDHPSDAGRGAEFRCVLDGRLAGTVTLDADGDGDGVRARLDVVVPWARVTFFEFPGAVVDALRRADPDLLHTLHPEFAPFWCPTCAASYCDEHWDRYDVEDEGFHDETRGICPRGHERMLLD